MRVPSYIDKKCRESSIDVMSSRYEGLAMSLLKAIACGLPAVSCDCDCGQSEITYHIEDSFIVEMGNIHDEAEKLIYPLLLAYRLEHQ